MSTTILENFEDSSFQFDFSGDWVRTSSVSHSGLYSYKSSNRGVDDSLSYTEFVVTPTENSILEINCKVSSEENYDFGRILLDGEILWEGSGELGWLTVVEPLNKGVSYTVRVEYEKDASTYSGSDEFYIDDISLKYGDLLPPNEIIEIINGTGTETLSQIDENPYSPDSENWQAHDEASNSFNFIAKVGFPLPSKPLYGTQKFLVNVGRAFSFGIKSPTVYLVLLENGTELKRTEGITIGVEDQVCTMEFDVSILSDPSGAGIQFKFIDEPAYSSSGGFGGLSYGEVTIESRTGTTYYHAKLNAVNFFANYKEQSVSSVPFSHNFDTKQGVFTNEKSSSDSKQKLFEKFSIYSDMDQSLYEKVLNGFGMKQRTFTDKNYNLDMKQNIFGDFLKNLKTIQSVYEVTLIDFNTKQGIFANTNYSRDTQQSLFGKSTLDFDMKQGIFTFKQHGLDTQQRVYGKSLLDFDMKQRSYKDFSNYFDGTQVVYTSRLYRTDTQQRLFNLAASTFNVLLHQYKETTNNADFRQIMFSSVSNTFDLFIVQLKDYVRSMDINQSMYSSIMKDIDTYQSVFSYEDSSFDTRQVMTEHGIIRDFFIDMVINQYAYNQYPKQTKQEYFEDKSYSADSLQNMVYFSHSNFDSKQIVFKNFSNRYKVISDLYRDIKESFPTKIYQYRNISNMVHTVQKFTAYKQQSYETSMTIYDSDKKSVFEMNQRYLQNVSSEYGTKQLMNTVFSLTGDTYVVISANSKYNVGTQQTIYEDTENTFDTKQSLFDSRDIVIDVIELDAERSLYVVFNADRDVLIELNASREVYKYLGAERNVYEQLEASREVYVALEGEVDMTVEDQNIVIYSGDSKLLRFAVRGMTSTEIQSSTITWSLREGRYSENTLLEKTRGSGISIVDGDVQVELTSKETGALLGDYYQTCKVVDPRNHTSTVLSGSVTIING